MDDKLKSSRDAEDRTAPEEENKDNHTQIAENSLRRSRAIEKKLFKALAATSSSLPASFIFVTRDILTGLVSAPITNLDHAKYGKPLGLDSEGGTVLSAFRREALPAPRKGAGALSDVFISLMRESGDGVNGPPVGLCYLVEVSEAGVPNRIIEFGVDGNTREKTEGRWGGEVMDDRALKFLEDFSSMTESPGERFLFVRQGAEDRDDLSGREFQLFQTGFVVIKQGTDVFDSTLLRELALRGATSEFASLAILLEKERYYEKAARQSVRGDMVKLDKLSAVAKEYEALERLKNSRRLHVPQLTGEDKAIGEYRSLAERGASGIDAWYRMRNFTLPTLSDLLTSVQGFHDYELQTIISATLEHLEHTYWESRPEHYGYAREHLVAVLALTHARMDDTIRAFGERTYAMEVGEPVKIGGRVGFFEQTDVDVVKALGTALTADTPFEVCVEWGGGQEVIPCENGSKCFEALWDGLAELEEKAEFRVAQVESPHGDPHFANIMIDASIPEDPLVVSIDQGSGIFRADQVGHVMSWLNMKDADDGGFTKSLGLGGMDLRKVIGKAASAEQSGLHYDFAKLMMSAACIYPLALRGGTTTEKVRGEYGTSRFLVTKSRGKPEELRESGGISGAQIVRLDERVPDDAWFYHSVAAKLIAAKFVRLLEERKEIKPGDVVLGLVCLWLLTVRHSFSIAEILFPRKTSAAVTMLLMAMRLLNKGKEVVVSALSMKAEDRGVLKKKLLEVFEIDLEKP